MYNKLNEFMERKSSKFLTDFQKNCSVQYAQLRMTENWKTQLNKRNKIGVIIIYLSYAFDIVNSQPYGLDSNATSFMRSYVTNRYQSCKIRHSLSEFERITAGVPQGSILGHLLFEIFINDIFLCIENSDLCNYVDDSTLNASGKSLSIITENLKANF